MLRQNHSDSTCIFSSKSSHPYIYSRPFIFFKIQEYFTYPPELGGGYGPSYISRYKYITFVYSPQTWKICDSKFMTNSYSISIHLVFFGMVYLIFHGKHSENTHTQVDMCWCALTVGFPNSTHKILPSLLKAIKECFIKEFIYLV